ncbi:MAG: DUF547 domain-containing protein [Bacteroidetes bacterium]|nr:DUF547 domain-containing protein [Bacteroidota bacterium]
MRRRALSWCALLVLGGFAQPGAAQGAHQVWDRLLRLYVRSDGAVDYEAFRADTALLRRYLDRLDRFSLSRASTAQRAAYWINFWNAATVYAVLLDAPRRSVLEGHGLLGLHIPGWRSFWDAPRFKRLGRPISLRSIYDSLRALERDPRWLFALYRPARGGPPLRPEAYRAERLEEQLEDQVRLFLRRYNRIPDSPRTIRLSRLFEWHAGLFARQAGSVQRWLAPYFEGSVAARLAYDGYRIRYLPYDWSLDQPTSRRVSHDAARRRSGPRL